MGDIQKVEHLLLDVSAVYSDTATCCLCAVAYQVVGVRTNFARICIQEMNVLLVWCGEGVVGRIPSLLFFVPFKQREVEYPEERWDPAVQAVYPFLA